MAPQRAEPRVPAALVAIALGVSAIACAGRPLAHEAEPALRHGTAVPGRGRSAHTSLQPGTGATSPLGPVACSQLRVSAGRISALGPTRFASRSPTLRADLLGGPRRELELSFTYAGPSDTTAPLASGELRRQIGVKLRSENTC